MFPPWAPALRSTAIDGKSKNAPKALLLLKPGLRPFGGRELVSKNSATWVFVGKLAPPSSEVRTWMVGFPVGEVPNNPWAQAT